MTKKVSVDQSNLRLWASTEDKTLCRYGQTITLRQYEDERLVPVHYNNAGLPVILYADDFTWLLRTSMLGSVDIISQSGPAAVVRGLKTGETNVVLHDGTVQHMLNVNIYHSHTAGAAATCTSPQTCTTCGEVLKKALGHIETGGCTTNVTCVRCKAVISGPTGHIPGPAATCTTAQNVPDVPQF